MYNDFFGFNEKPFSIAPNPRYLYMSPHHEDALAHLLYGIQEGNGFVLLTGEVGTGKTTLCNCLLAQLPPRTEVAYILNPRLTVNELLATLCDEFSIPYPTSINAPTSNKRLIDGINQFLLQAHAEGRPTVLIIDEAQNLSHEVLEQIRLLTNLETYEKKLLQIILIGQPELREKFSRPELRQLAQRITARFHLHELSLQEVHGYINHRIEVATATGRAHPKKIFSARAEKKIHRLSGGIPRLINLLCDRSLLAAYTQNRQTISDRLVRSASEEVLPAKAQQTPHYLAPSFAGILLFSLALITAIYFLVTPGSPPLTLSTAKLNHSKPSPTQPSHKSLHSTTHLTPQTKQHNKPPARLQKASPESLGLPPVRNAPTQAALKQLPFPTNITPQQTQRMAFQTLFDRWHITPQALSSNNECALAQQNQLQCLFLKSNLGSLKRLNRPAILRLVHPSGGEYYATLISMTETNATLSIAGERVRVTLAAIEANWYGDSTLLWRPPEVYQRAINPAHPGPSTHWLREQLSQLPLAPAQHSGFTYIAPLPEQLKQFQRSQGLDPDGIAGAHTLILLNSALHRISPTLRPAKEGSTPTKDTAQSIAPLLRQTRPNSTSNTPPNSPTNTASNTSLNTQNNTQNNTRTNTPTHTALKPKES